MPWHMTIISATWEVKAGGQEVQASPSNLVRPYLKTKTKIPPLQQKAKNKQTKPPNDEKKTPSFGCGSTSSQNARLELAVVSR